MDAEALLKKLAKGKMDELGEQPGLKDYPEIVKLKKELLSSMESGDLSSLVNAMEKTIGFLKKAVNDTGVKNEEQKK